VKRPNEEEMSPELAREEAMKGLGEKGGKMAESLELQRPIKMIRCSARDQGLVVKTKQAAKSVKTKHGMFEANVKSQKKIETYAHQHTRFKRHKAKAIYGASPDASPEP
jgi:hypothetical protein